MSLLVWTPLISDYSNQGLSNLTFSPVNSNSTSLTADGKIAATCYYNNSNTSGALVSDKTIDLGTKLTMCCWVKFSSLMAASNLGGAMGGQHRYSNNTGMGLTLKYASVSTGYLAINTGDGSSRTYVDYCGQTLLNANTWYHVAFTYDGSTIKLYVNGALDKSYSYSAQKNVEDYITIGAWSFANTTGPAVHFNYKLLGSMNDFRIYNHVLTNNEIKELAQGLAAHWQLKGQGKTNYLVGSGKYTENNPLIRKASDSSNLADSYKYHDNDLSVYVPIDGTYTWILESNGVPSGHVTSGTVGSAHQFSMWVQNTSTSTHYNWTNYGTGPDGRHYGSVTIPAGNYRVRTNLYAADSANYTLKFWNMKFIEGNYNPNDPWGPNENDELYTAFGLDQSIETDCSGFGNDGVKSTVFEISSGSPRYDSCYRFSGSQYIACGRGAMVRDAITVNWWGYSDSWDLYGRALSCTEGGGWNFEIQNGKLFFQIGTGASSNTYAGVSATTPLTNIPLGWHMITGTYDGFSSKIYIDGQLEGTYTPYTTKTPVFYNATNGIFIGAEAQADQITPYPNYFTGKLSDVRIYGTALSQDDIIDLYNISASLKKDGTFHCHDIIEDNRNSSITRNGIVTSNGFNNKTLPTYDMKVKALGDGSTWARIHHLDVTNDKVYFKNATEVENCKEYNRYSKINLATKFKNNDQYEYMLTYPSLKATVPAGYTQLEYIEATGTQYINTGVKGNARWEFDIEFTDTSTRQLMGYGGGGQEYWGVQPGGHYGVINEVSLPNTKAGTRDTVIHDFEKKIIWTQNQQVTAGTGNDVSAKEYRLFGITTAGYNCKAKLYSCRCLQSNAIIREFVPAQRNSDGAIGLMDIQNKVFYANAGTGTFYSNYSWLNYIESTGTQYIDTGVVPSNHMIEITYDSGDYNNDEHLFGTAAGASYYHFTLYNNKYYWGRNGNESNGGAWSKGVKTLQFNCGENCAVIQDGVMLGSGAAMASTSNITLCRRTATNFKGRIYSCRITEKSTGNIVRDFVPCISNGVVGLYDKINRTFYGNSGSGSFIAGTKGGYQKLEYIEGTGTQYINTGICADNNTRIVIKAYSTAGYSVYGSNQSGAQFNLTATTSTNPGQMYFYWGSGGKSATVTYLSQVHTFEQDKNVCKIDGTTIHTYSNATWTGTHPLYLFARNNNNAVNDIGGTVRIYSCQIYKSGSLIRDYVPAVNGAGQVGLYDNVTKAFYLNAGSGNFNAGPALKSAPVYNRWIQTSDPTATATAGFFPIMTAWPLHNGGLHKQGGSTVYSCDSATTWFAAIGQLAQWTETQYIPAANGSSQTETELWIRTDRLTNGNSLKIYNDFITATDFNEM